VKAQPTTGALDTLSRIVFAVIATILLLLALALAGDAAFQFVMAIWTGQGIGEAALVGIGYVVVSVATFEISKYVIEEEVVRGREMRVASEARRSLTRFISTIAIAIFLEGLVVVFRVGKDNVPHLIYPTALLIAGILLILGLGVYQRLSAIVEEEVEEKDIADEKEERRARRKS
jgi:MFS family permease